MKQPDARSLRTTGSRMRRLSVRPLILLGILVTLTLANSTATGADRWVLWARTQDRNWPRPAREPLDVYDSKAACQAAGKGVIRATVTRIRSTGWAVRELPDGLSAESDGIFYTTECWPVGVNPGGG
jgi:hypothetical protein